MFSQGCPAGSSSGRCGGAGRSSAASCARLPLTCIADRAGRGADARGHHPAGRRGQPAGGELPPGSGGLLADPGCALIAPGPAVMPAAPDPAQVAGAIARYMALREFRARLYGCLTARADALFELTDAILCADHAVTSLVQLSLVPAFPPRARRAV